MGFHHRSRISTGELESLRASHTHRTNVDFAIDASGYGQLQSDAVIRKLKQDFYRPNGCKARTEACTTAGNNAMSNRADDCCVRFKFLLVMAIPE